MTSDSVHHGTTGTESHSAVLGVQALGLSPLLAVSDTVNKAIGLGLATTIALIIGCLTASLLLGLLIAGVSALTANLNASNPRESR
jgi:Na+-translocating ferredoxin:NAD+ oxidoreductase RnfE subunit